MEPVGRMLFVAIAVLVLCFLMAGPIAAQQNCPCLGCKKPVETVTPCDPNEKIGPDGFGEGRFVRSLNGSYTIFFENQATAAVPAQRVAIADDLAAVLDEGTIQLGDVAFGSQVVGDLYGLHTGSATVPLERSSLVVQVSVTLDSDTRRLQWILQTIDPRTGQQPDEVDAGFLPPNDSTGRGEGHVSFTVQPRAGLPTGTQIANAATIFFDTNAGIATNPWVNTIDVGSPSSRVSSLPAVSPSSDFSVTWSGNDDPSGSGIAGFTIMVSADDGPFSAWLTLSTATTGTFAGLRGHTYRFFSIAQDNVGNVESKTPVAEATTTVSLNSKPIAEAGDPLVRECTGNRSAPATLNGAASHDPDGDPLTYKWSAPSIIFDDPTSATPTSTFPLGETTATLIVNDGKVDSDPDTVAITVRDTQAPTVSCPAEVTAECQGLDQTSVHLPVATAADACEGSVPIINSHTPGGADASGSYPLGDTPITFTAEDGSGNQSTCQTHVRVVDTTSPTIGDPLASPALLWPPDHTMRNVSVGYSAADLCSPVHCALTVTSNEPVNGTGDGDVAPDWVVLDDHHLQLRAERAGTGSGRVYIVSINCSDTLGHASTKSATVPVPHDLRMPNARVP